MPRHARSPAAQAAHAPPTQAPPTTLASAQHLQDRVAAAAAIDDPVARLTAAAQLIATVTDDVEAERAMRYALAFAGADRYFPTADQLQRRCHARAEPGGPLCDKPFYARELCRSHFNAFNKGTPWGAGGLNMDHEPRPSKWRTKAVADAGEGVIITTLNDALEPRRWPTGDGGWTDDRAQAAHGREHELWRWDHASGDVVPVAEPPVYPDPAAHWAAFGDAHRAAVALHNALNQLREIRHGALFGCFAAGMSSNRELAELADMNENSIYKLRARYRAKHGLPSPQAPRVPKKTVPAQPDSPQRRLAKALAEHRRTGGQGFITIER